MALYRTSRCIPVMKMMNEYEWILWWILHPLSPITCPTLASESLPRCWTSFAFKAARNSLWGAFEESFDSCSLLGGTLVRDLPTGATPTGKVAKNWPWNILKPRFHEQCEQWAKLETLATDARCTWQGRQPSTWQERSLPQNKDLKRLLQVWMDMHASDFIQHHP